MEALEVVSDRDRVDALSSAFCSGRLEAFLTGCSGQLAVTFRGTGAASTVFGYHDLISWWTGLNSLVEGQLHVEVELVMPTGPSIVVVLAYRFICDGQVRCFETVNYCTVRDGSLVAWFAGPLDRRQCAEAPGCGDGDQGSPMTDRMVGARS
jgi:hypothetical protein